MDFRSHHWLLMAVLLACPVAQAGTLQGSAAGTPATVDLTAEGASDWAHWGHLSSSSMDTKAAGGGQIANYAVLGGATPVRGSSQSSGYSWTDGAPTASATNSRTGLRVFSADKGFTFTVPADTQNRTLKVFLGARFAIGELTATLSDSSATDVVIDIESLAGKSSSTVTLDYAADSAGEQLVLEYVLKEEAAGETGWAALESAALTGGGGGGSGTLSGAATVAASNIDLTAEGVDDWAHWALTSASSFDQKAGVTNQIGDYTPLNGVTPARVTNLVARYSWSDGAPAATANNTRTGLKVFAVDTGFSFTAQADTSVRTLDVYVGLNRGIAELTATLSDGSAAPVTVQLTEDTGKASYRVRLSYSAASAGQQLTVEYLLKTKLNPSSAWASLESATLVGGGTGNSAPVLDPIGDQSITEGEQLLVALISTDADGPAPLLLSETNDLPGSPGILSDNGDGTGLLDWQSAVGDSAGSPYQVTVRATDGAGALVEETIVVTVLPAGGGGGGLSGSSAVAASNVDLTAEGVDDWTHWALTTAGSLDRKVGVTPQIGDYSPLNGATPIRATNLVARYSWSDGDPTATTNNTRTGLKLFNLDAGFSFSVPADTATRTLRVYVGLNRGTGAFTATLSDGSAAPFTTQLVNSTGKASYVVELSFSAATGGEQLDVEYLLEEKANPSSAWISLESAALVGGAGGNAAPVLDDPGDQSVTEGQSLVVALAATDLDGPAPIVLSETNTLPGSPSIITDNGDGTGELDWQPALGDAGGSPYTVTVRATDGLGAFSEETITVTVLPGGGGGGSLTGGAASAAASVNLSSLGSLDWAHWGLASASSFDSRIGAGLISDYTPLGGANPARGTTQATSYSWSDGDPTLTASNSATGIKVFSVDRGFRFTVPADTTPRTLYAYVGARHGTGSFTATLSDGSAVEFATDLVATSLKQTWLVTVDYAAATVGETLTVDYVLTAESNSASGWASLESVALADGAALELPYAEDFSSGAPNWLTVDDTNNSSDWQAVAGVYRQNNAMGITDLAMSGAAHTGTYSYLANGSQLTDYTLSVDVTPLADSGQDVGVMLRVNPAAGDYLRLSFSGANSFGRLELANAGVFAALAKDARGALPNTPMNLEVRVSGPVVMAYRDGTLLYGAYEESLTAGTVALYCRDACEFDDLLIDTPATGPAIAIASPVAYSVSSASVLDVSAVVMNAPAGATVEFDVPGESSPCGPATETSPGLFTASCTLSGAGIYVLEAELRSSTNSLLDADSRSNVGVGVNFAAVGDSITAGLDDPTASDAVSANGFVVGVQGYEATLTDLLEDAGETAVVFNNGVPGDKSVQLAEDRITGVLQRHPDASEILLTIGVNDAGGGAFTASGLGCSGAACDGTFAGYVQDAVDAAVGQGKTVVLAQTPPRFGDPQQVPHPTPETHPQNLRIEDEYNEVILNQINNVTAGPDFYDFFLGAENRFYLYETNLHPNALGYHAMAVLFDQVLTGSTAEPFFASNLCVRSVTAGSCEAPLTYKQNLLDSGNEVYVDEGHTLDGSVPAVLADGRWIQTADADKDLSHSDYLEFDLPLVADVYVAYDDAATTTPAWLAAFTATADTITTSNSAADTLRLYRLTGAIGTVTLGGADATANGAGANYLVIIVE